MAKGRGQRAEGRGQRAEGRGQRAEGRRQKVYYWYVVVWAVRSVLTFMATAYSTPSGHDIIVPLPKLY
jgi:hypothetical protein